MELKLLNLGDMLAFVGLLVAALQLIKPRYSLIWKLSSRFLKISAVLLLIIGFLSPLIAATLANNATLIATFSSVEIIQILGFISISFGIIVVSLLYSPFNVRRLVQPISKYKITTNRYPLKRWTDFSISVNRERTVTSKSMRKFYEVTSVAIMRGHVTEVVELTRVNLKHIVPAATGFKTSRFESDPEAVGKQKKKPGASNYAFEFIYQLLTDKFVMNHICNYNRLFIHAIIEYETEMSVSEVTRILYPNLMENLILNKDSYLYSQIQAHYGYARFANLYDLITSDKVAGRIRIIPSQMTWKISKSDVQVDDYTAVIIELLERLVEKYKVNPYEGIIFQNIKDIMGQLIGDNGVTRQLAYDHKARKLYADDAIESAAYKVLSKIRSSYTSGLIYRDEDPEVYRTSVEELNSVNSHGEYDQHTLIGLLADKAFELIQDLTVLFTDTKEPDDALRREAYSYLSMHEDTPITNKYRELVWNHLFDKAVDGNIEEYSTNLEGYYPNVLRFMIDSLVPFNPRWGLGIGSINNRMKQIMNNELKDALLSHKMMKNDVSMEKELLPANVECKINQKNKTVKYYYLNSKGKRTLIDLSPDKIPAIEVKKSSTTKPNPPTV